MEVNRTTWEFIKGVISFYKTIWQYPYGGKKIQIGILMLNFIDVGLRYSDYYGSGHSEFEVILGMVPPIPYTDSMLNPNTTASASTWMEFMCFYFFSHKQKRNIFSRKTVMYKVGIKDLLSFTFRTSCYDSTKQVFFELSLSR